MTSGERPLPDEPFDRVLTRAVQRHDGSGACPDPAELASFVEGTLSAAERKALENHAAACARCSAELATLARLPAAGLAAGTPPVQLARPWTWRWAIPLATAVVAFAVWTEIRDDGPQPAPTELARSEAPSGPAAGADRPTGGAERDTDVANIPSPPDANGPAAQVPASPREQPLSEETVRPDRLLKRAPVGAEREEGQAAEAGAPPGAAASAPDSLRDEFRAEGNETKATAESAPEPPPSPAAPPIAAGARKAREAPAVGRFAGGAPLVVHASASIRVRAGGNGIERSTDGGRTWRREHDPVKSQVLSGVCPSPDVCWLAGEAGLVLRREASGRWLDVSHPPASRILRIEADDALHATLTTADGGRLTTADGGVSWSPAP